MGRSTESDIALAARAEELERTGVRVEAEKLVPSAFKAIREVLRHRGHGDRGPSHGAKVSAAKLILEHAHGKPTQQVHHFGDGGVTVNILQVGSGGHPHRVELDVTPPPLKIEAADEPF